MQPTAANNGVANTATQPQQGQNALPKENVQALAKVFNAIVTKVMDAANENANNQ
ncbi:MAG: hypothetical protein R3D34_17300 [Nitratireductor sp.]